MIDTQIIKDTISLKDAKLSDWLENQPLSRWTAGLIRNDYGGMCAWGFIADFLGYEWSKDKDIEYYGAYTFVRKTPFDKIINFGKYDKLYARAGVHEARKYVINTLREHGY